LVRAKRESKQLEREHHFHEPVGGCTGRGSCMQAWKTHAAHGLGIDLSGVMHSIVSGAIAGVRMGVTMDKLRSGGYDLSKKEWEEAAGCARNVSGNFDKAAPLLGSAELGPEGPATGASYLWVQCWSAFAGL
jgi:hypothetical protein